MGLLGLFWQKNRLDVGQYTALCDEQLGALLVRRISRKSTELLIKLPFQRLVREGLQDRSAFPELPAGG